MFDEFLNDFAKSFAGKNPVISGVLANVFSMRIIGNKTHGDLAEIALTEYINEYMPGYTARHTGKEHFRAKQGEEDIQVTQDSTGIMIPISIKTYGVGPLQLSTNKTSSMFMHLSQVIGTGNVTDGDRIRSVVETAAFADFDNVNVLPLIYDEKKLSFKIQVFDLAKAYSSIRSIKFLEPRKLGNKMTFPIYKFYGEGGQYIFEVRYGGTGANALQRGMWTHTVNASPFFRELLDDTYKVNETLVVLMAKMLVATETTHKRILSELPGTKNIL